MLVEDATAGEFIKNGESLYHLFTILTEKFSTTTEQTEAPMVKLEAVTSEVVHFMHFVETGVST